MESLRKIIKNILNSSPILGRYLIWKGGKGSKLLALTFDDGPLAGNTERLLSILEKTETPATFFLIGCQVSKFPQITKRIYKNGHTIANHTYSHNKFDELSNEGALREIAKGFEEIEYTLGFLPNKYFRAPKGEIRWRLLPSLFKKGIKLFFWTVDPKDFLLKEPQKILDSLLDFNYKGGEIILLHDYVPGTIAIISTFITFMEKKGFRFVTVDEICQDKKD